MAAAGDGMFDFAWSEIALVGIVALLVIGPKDLPEAVRGVARGIAKLRRMASQFQGQADELVREANLDEVRNSINEIRNFNVRDQLSKAIDEDGSIRKTFSEDPLKTDYSAPHKPPAVTEPAAAPAEALAGPAEGTTTPPEVAEPPRAPAAPAFIPPAFVPPPAEAPATMAAAAPPPAPAFVPPPDGPVPAGPAPEHLSAAPVPMGPPNPTQQS